MPVRLSEMREMVVVKGMHMIEFGVQYEKDNIMMELLAEKCRAYGWTIEYARKAVESTMAWKEAKLDQWRLDSKLT